LDSPCWAYKFDDLEIERLGKAILDGFRARQRQREYVTINALPNIGGRRGIQERKDRGQSIYVAFEKDSFAVKVEHVSRSRNYGRPINAMDRMWNSRILNLRTVVVYSKLRT
jgi:hypothetical protein